MIAYRSIGESELLFLIKTNNPIYGKARHYPGCGVPDVGYGVVCFFDDPIRWADKQHLFHISVEIPDDAISGTGIYRASEKFGETGIWTGREGKTEYRVHEHYVRCYYPKNIKTLEVGKYYTDTFVNTAIIPFCKKYGIKLFQDGKETKI